MLDTLLFILLLASFSASFTPPNDRNYKFSIPKGQKPCRDFYDLVCSVNPKIFDYAPGTFTKKMPSEKSLMEDGNRKSCNGFKNCKSKFTTVGGTLIRITKTDGAPLRIYIGKMESININNLNANNIKPTVRYLRYNGCSSFIKDKVGGFMKQYPDYRTDSLDDAIVYVLDVDPKEKTCFRPIFYTPSSKVLNVTMKNIYGYDTLVASRTTLEKNPGILDNIPQVSDSKLQGLLNGLWKRWSTEITKVLDTQIRTFYNFISKLSIRMNPAHACDSSCLYPLLELYTYRIYEIMVDADPTFYYGHFNFLTPQTIINLSLLRSRNDTAYFYGAVMAKLIEEAYWQNAKYNLNHTDCELSRNNNANLNMESFNKLRNLYAPSKAVRVAYQEFKKLKPSKADITRFFLALGASRCSDGLRPERAYNLWMITTFNTLYSTFPKFSKAFQCKPRDPLYCAEEDPTLYKIERCVTPRD